MGHDFAQYASQREFLNRRSDAKAHPFETRLLDSLVEWLDKRMAE
jgi:hypothetical protein